MPLREYKCSAYGVTFEELIRGEVQIVCPKCGSTEVERQLSSFSACYREGRGNSGSASGTCTCTTGCCPFA